MNKNKKGKTLFITLLQQIPTAVYKLRPQYIFSYPVLFVSEVAALLASIYTVLNFSWFNFSTSLLIWSGLVFSMQAESLAEMRSKAQAQALRSDTKTAIVQKVVNYSDSDRDSLDNVETQEIEDNQLQTGDLIKVKANDIVPLDGDIISGVVSIDESAVTGESAPVIREAGGDRTAVIGGTKIVSDSCIYKVTKIKGEGFIDKLISLVESAKRQKTPNEIAMTILLSSLTLIFLVVITAFAYISGKMHMQIEYTVFIALFIGLIPTTIGGLLSAIGIAGIDRLVKQNVIAFSGKAIEAAGDVDTLMIDKTGTITLGNRQCSELIPMKGVAIEDLAHGAYLASIIDETAEGRSVVKFVKEKYNIRHYSKSEIADTKFIPFSAFTRMSGVDLPDGRKIRKGAVQSITDMIEREGGNVGEAHEIAHNISVVGGTPLIVYEEDNSKNKRILGAIYLKDALKNGIVSRFNQIRAMGVKTVMLTGDNPITARFIAKEANIDEYLAEIKPQDKMNYIIEEQRKGKLVAMTGDGTNDAPALAKADIAVAMNTGTSAAKDASNIIDLDSNPTKILDIVKTGKEMLITRGSITTFSIVNDIAKYFAILPQLFASSFDKMSSLNIMHMHSLASSVISMLIFNSFIVLALIPLTLRGTKFKTSNPIALFKLNMLIYGLGGLVTPFIAIKLIDMFVSSIFF
jgi:K+-transporting ATPase ATPase B chain